MNQALTEAERNEPLMVSIGRMRIILQGLSKSSYARTLALFEKIASEAAENEIKVMKYAPDEQFIKDRMLEAREVL